MCARGRKIAEPLLSPDGERVAFLSTAAGLTNIVAAAATGGAEVALTADPVAGAHPNGGGVVAWTPDGSALVHVGKNGDLRRVDLGGGIAEVLVSGALASCPAVSPDGHWVAYIRDGRDVAVAANDPSTAAPWPMRLSSGRSDFALDPVWSADGRSVAWLEWDAPDMAWDASRIVVAPLDGREDPRTVAGGPGVGAQQPQFSPDGRHLGYLCDANGWLNLWIADPDGKNARPLVEEPFEHGMATWGPGQRTWTWSPDGARVAFCRNEGGFGRLCIAEVGSGAVQEVAKAWHVSLTWRGAHLAGLRSGARTTPHVVTYSPSEQDFRSSRTAVATAGIAFPKESLVEPEVVHWQAEDGIEVHGRLYRPQGVEGAAPMLVWVHGGPTDQQQVMFNARVAYFVERGWAVLVPDHRGSTGWGRDYTQAMTGRWGDLDSSDTAAGIRTAIERGWADPDRVVPIGASAGGFTVLCLLAWHGDLCAAGVDLYGVADLFEQGDTDSRFEAHYMDSLVGPLPEAHARYAARSPVNLAERIQRPLLVLHGSDDRVVSLAQSERLVAAIRAAGGIADLHVYDGEGHGWSRPETTEDELERVERFLERAVLLSAK